MFKDEIRIHLVQKILPFWMGLKDEKYGGFYGHMDNNLLLNRTADKGCILNSRILWTFSTAARQLGNPEYREFADCAMDFFSKFEDPDNGGVYWSVTFDGRPADTTKHTYCQAFAVYGLAAYYRLTGKQEALDKAMNLFRIMESRCKDENGYLEAMKADFSPESNEKLSENGIMASRTMNTLLHVVEAYTELHRACPDGQVMVAAVEGLNQLLEKVYNPEKRRLEVFFDGDFQPILDMQSYGHDIESSWLIWDAAEYFLRPDGREAWQNMCQDLLESTVLYVSTLMLGLLLGTLCEASTLLNPKVAPLVILGVCALTVSGITGVLGGWILYWFKKGEFNPVVGISGVSCVPTTAKIAQHIAEDEDPFAIVLPVAMGANIGGVIVSAIACGVFIATIGMLK